MPTSKLRLRSGLRPGLSVNAISNAVGGLMPVPAPTRIFVQPSRIASAGRRNHAPETFGFGDQTTSVVERGRGRRSPGRRARPLDAFDAEAGRENAARAERPARLDEQAGDRRSTGISVRNVVLRDRTCCPRARSGTPTPAERPTTAALEVEPDSGRSRGCVGVTRGHERRIDEAGWRTRWARRSRRADADGGTCGRIAENRRARNAAQVVVAARDSCRGRRRGRADPIRTGRDCRARCDRSARPRGHARRRDRTSRRSPCPRCGRSRRSRRARRGWRESRVSPSVSSQSNVAAPGPRAARAGRRRRWSRPCP